MRRDCILLYSKLTTKIYDMKITVKRDNLAAALDVVSKGVPSRAFIPIMESLLFDVIGDKCYIYSRNPEYQVRGYVRVNSDEDHQFCVPGRLFSNTVRHLTDEEIMISSTAKDNKFNTTISVSGKKKKYKMPGVDPAMFAVLKVDEEMTVRVKLNGESFLEGIRKCSGISNPKDIRRSIAGTSIRNEGTGIEISSGRMDVCCRVDIGSEEIIPEINLMKSTTAMLECLPTPSQIELGVDGNLVSISTGQFVVISTMIDEKYPDFKAVWDSSIVEEDFMVVNKEEFIASMRRLSLYSSSENNAMKITINDDSITISAENKAFSTSAFEEVESESNTLGRFSSGFNTQTISQALSKIETESVAIHIKDEKQPMFIREVDNKGAVEQKWMVAAISLVGGSQ